MTYYGHVNNPLFLLLGFVLVSILYFLAKAIIKSLYPNDDSQKLDN